ncbi:DUF6900 domain-containing protein [Burkholderia cenocepacia]|uniref:DUF6900 domain-containing protein n=1 Tax=Burkholderia cenocepacia TaxID=95486 RepID=UPI0022320911
MTHAEFEVLLEQIARDHLSIDTLTTRYRDCLDFHDVAVWCVRSALIEAYEAGRTIRLKARD